MGFLRLLVVLIAGACAVLAFAQRLREARRAAGPSAEALFLLTGSLGRALLGLVVPAFLLTAVRGIGFGLAFVWAIVTVPLLVNGFLRVVVVAADGLVVGRRKYPWSDFAGVADDAARGRLVLFGRTEADPRLELRAAPPRRAALLAALRRRLPEFAD